MVDDAESSSITKIGGPLTAGRRGAISMPS
jgi:hypothetical protein